MPSGSFRTIEELKMGIVCLENLWKQKLLSLGWNAASTARFLRTWAPTTMNMYNKAVAKFCSYLDSKGVSMLSVPQSTVAEYLCKIASSSQRPKS